MHPIRTEHSNFTYQGPTPEIADLPCRVDRNSCYATYAFTDEEREAIAQGANVEIAIHQRPIPPISLIVTDATEVEGDGDIRCPCGALWLRERGLAVCGHCGRALDVD